MEYQLVIGQLLQTGLTRAPAQRITDADQVGMSCADMGQRVGRCHRWALVRARAPWLRPGYLRNPEGSEALWRGGWLHTGDVGNMAADGRCGSPTG